jgi:hypothetical protein
MIFALGCQGNGGAVSVRWRIVDLTTGQEIDPGDVKAADGSCCNQRDATSNLCLPSNPWIIESVNIVMGEATTGTPIQTPLKPFACSLREKTTPFVLQPGTFAVSLAATNDIGDGMNVPAPVALPPPSVRTITSGDVVNLDVIEIGVNPLPH